MTMKAKSCLFILFVMVLNLPSVAYSQCADIFKQGVSLMEAKKYESAISYFQKAKKCDNKLTKQCDEKISECRKFLNSGSNSISTTSKLITLDKEILNFGQEETNAKSVKVSSAIDWVCTSDADWCTVIKKNGNSFSVNCGINLSANMRTAIIRVNNGKDTKNIKVIQKGMDAILNIIPDQVELGKNGDLLRIPLECNIDYEVQSKPEWVNVVAQNKDMLIIEVGAYSFARTENVRQGVLSISSSDGKTDFVIVAQLKKYRPSTVVNTNKARKDTQSNGSSYKGSKRKTLF